MPRSRVVTLRLEPSTASGATLACAAPATSVAPSAHLWFEPHCHSVTDAAMMIGIHRMPRHKTMRALGQQRPRISVTYTIVSRVVEWCKAHRIARLVACPYDELPKRLQALGFVKFVRVPDPARSYTLGTLELRADVCEDAALHVLDVAQWVDRPASEQQ